jgi:hypothetical protein
LHKPPPAKPNVDSGYESDDSGYESGDDLVIDGSTPNEEYMRFNVTTQIYQSLAGIPQSAETAAGSEEQSSQGLMGINRG